MNQYVTADLKLDGAISMSAQSAICGRSSPQPAAVEAFQSTPRPVKIAVRAKTTYPSFTKAHDAIGIQLQILRFERVARTQIERVTVLLLSFFGEHDAHFG